MTARDVPAAAVGPRADGPAGTRRPGRHGRRALRAPVLTGVGLASATALLALRTPHRSGSYGFCPFLLLTGMACPGCGGLRAVHELTHLDVAAAWGMNALVVVLVPVAAAVWSIWLLRAFRAARDGGPPPVLTRVPAPLGWGALGVVLGFGALRNVPALAPWLTPWLV